MGNGAWTVFFLVSSVQPSTSPTWLTLTVKMEAACSSKMLVPTNNGHLFWTCIFHQILPFREVFYVCTSKSVLVVGNCWNTFFGLEDLESLCFQRFMEMLAWVEPYCWLCKVQCWMFCCRWSLATVVFCWRYRLLRVTLKWPELMQKLLKILPRFVAVLLLMCVCTVRQVAKSV